MITKEIEING